MPNFPENSSDATEQVEAPNNNLVASNLSLSDLSFLSFFMPPQAAQEIFSPEFVESNDSGAHPPDNSF